MEGDAKEVAHHEGEEHGARRLGVFGDVSGDAGGHRGDASSFCGAQLQRRVLMEMIDLLETADESGVIRDLDLSWAKARKEGKEIERARA